MKTLREQYTQGLINMGFHRVETRSSKFHVFLGKFAKKDGTLVSRYVFLGKSGSVRLNTENRVSDSLSASEGMKKLILSRLDK